MPAKLGKALPKVKQPSRGERLGEPALVEPLPRHVAIIMDGNGRWAQQRQWRRIFGHREGARRVREVVEASTQMGINALTLFAFSEENWQRPVTEVNFLMELMNRYIEKETPVLLENNIRLRVIGEISRLPQRSQDMVTKAVDRLSGNTGLILTLALSYSGRADIAAACRQIAEKVARGELDPNQVDQQMLSQHVCNSDLPDPDFLIRTSGEQRISNFLLWQMAYTEFYFSPVYWPDFTKVEFLRALNEFARRERRFGKVTSSDVENGVALSSDLPAEVNEHLC